MQAHASPKLPIAIAIAVLSLLPLSASAAVRVCKPSIKTPVASGATEMEAKKGALDVWKSEALKNGVGYDSWRIAAANRLVCRIDGATHYCVAIGAPCVIRHVAPEGKARRERARPGGSPI